MACENAIDITVTELYLHGLLVNNICLLKNARTITKHTSDRSIWVSCSKCCVFCQVPNIFFWLLYYHDMLFTLHYHLLQFHQNPENAEASSHRSLLNRFFCINLFKFPPFFHHFNLLAQCGHFPFDISILIFFFFLTLHATE